MSSLKKVLVVFLILLGLVDSAYLTYKHFSGSNLVCTVTGGCEKVLTSRYAQFGPIPVALLGVLFYLTLLFLLIINRHQTNVKISKIIFTLSLLGAIGAIWFILIQAFVLHAWCQYCLVSDIIMILIFLILTNYKKPSAALTKGEVG